jgi:hypothetical protein
MCSAPRRAGSPPPRPAAQPATVPPSAASRRETELASYQCLPYIRTAWSAARPFGQATQIRRSLVAPLLRCRALLARSEAVCL